MVSLCVCVCDRRNVIRMNIYLWIHISELYMNTHSSWPFEHWTFTNRAMPFTKSQKETVKRHKKNIFLRYFVVVFFASIISMILFIEMRIFYCCHPWYTKFFMAFACLRRNFEQTKNGIEWNQDYWRAYVDNKIKLFKAFAVHGIYLNARIIILWTHWNNNFNDNNNQLNVLKIDGF